MAYLDQLLAEDEAIVFETRHHWFMLAARMVTKLVLLLLLLVAAALAPQFAPQAARVIQLGALVVGLIVVLTMWREYLAWSREQFVVTDRRVIQIRGVFNKTVLDSSLEKINDIEMIQTLFGRIFGFGTIDVLTASQEGINRLDHIAHPLQFKKAMLDARARYDHYQNYATPQAYQDMAVQDPLIQLASLHQRGILNDAEFEAKKREILSRM